MTLLRCLVLILLSVLNGQLSVGFKAAVFEHAEQSYATPDVPKDIIRNNLHYYIKAANFARSKGVEVIVFPEYGIFPPMSRKKLKNFLENIPDPNVTLSNPCTNPEMYSDRPILYTLSCLARTNNLIIVANLGDIQPCRGEKECPEDGAFHFNTNVAFGRDGTILAKYHKEHLFGESGMDLPIGQQNPTFKTDLGLFAMFVCFDIVYQRITEVAHWEGIKAVLLPTMWMNSSPMFASMQYFAAWAFGNNVSLLAANVHLPGQSGLGSCITKGRDGTKIYTFNPDGNSKLLITDLSKNEPSSSSMYIISNNGTKEWTEDGKDVASQCSKKVLKPYKDVYRDYRCLERDTTNFTLTKLTKTRDRITSCNNGMCCTLDYSAYEMKEDFYLGVYNGSFEALHYIFAEENCFVARCDGVKNKSCAIFPMRSETLFYKIKLKANFSTNFIYPTVLDSGMRLTSENLWKYKSNDKTASISFKNSSGKNILMVGFKARPYERDPPFIR